MRNKVSVITIVYNDCLHIRATMESFFAQTWADKEYIVIDGGSTDGTVDIIREYSDKIDYWCSEPDRGIYDALNKGINHCTGEWINVLNCGDKYASDNAIKNVMSQSYEDVDIIYGNSIEVYKDRKKIVIADDDPDGMKKKVIYRHGSSFIKSSLHKKHLFDLSKSKKLGYALDWQLIHKMYTLGYKFKKVDCIIEEYDLEGMSNHTYKNLWYNYLITSDGGNSLKTSLEFVKNVISALFKNSVVYKFSKAFGVEFMINDIMPHLPFYNIRKSYFKLIGMKIGKGTYLSKRIYFMNPWLVKIGNYSHINRGCLIDARGEIVIGNSVSISHDVKLVTGGHNINHQKFPVMYEKIQIDDYAWLGVGAIILKNVHIGYGAVICAGAVVTKDVEPYAIVGGIPAKVMGKRKEMEFDYKCEWNELFT